MCEQCNRADEWIANGGRCSCGGPTECNEQITTWPAINIEFCSACRKAYHVREDVVERVRKEKHGQAGT